MHNRTPDLGRLLGQLSHRSGVLGDRLYWRQDVEAMTHGWEIRRIWCGWGRRYRDPRVAQRVRPETSAVDDGELVGAVGWRR